MLSRACAVLCPQWMRLCSISRGQRGGRTQRTAAPASSCSAPPCTLLREPAQPSLLLRLPGGTPGPSPAQPMWVSLQDPGQVSDLPDFLWPLCFSSRLPGTHMSLRARGGLARPPLSYVFMSFSEPAAPSPSLTVLRAVCGPLLGVPGLASAQLLFSNGC